MAVTATKVHPMKPSIDPLVPPFEKNKAKRSATYAYDRIDIFIDRAELPFSKSFLKDHCSHLVETPRQPYYQARWKLKLQIFQPKKKCLRLLEEKLGADVALLLVYVEIACDLPATSKHRARLQRDSFMASTKMNYERLFVEQYARTYYFGRRTDGKTRSPRVLTVYADRPSKLLDARPDVASSPCMHIEVRLSGSPALEHEGIACLKDLIHFDHQAFWERSLRLYQLPKNNTELGRHLASASGDDPNVSGSALRKRASRWRERHTIVDGVREVFVMHNALINTPNLKKTLHKISFAEWLEEAMSL